jgi:hypothetical protein
MIMSLEIATDIMAILGWALFGAWLTPRFYRHIDDTEVILGAIFSMLSFGLIAASIVLG